MGPDDSRMSLGHPLSHPDPPRLFPGDRALHDTAILPGAAIAGLGGTLPSALEAQDPLTPHHTDLEG